MSPGYKPDYLDALRSGERDESGPRGTYGCACKRLEAAECHRRRYGIVAGDVSHGAEECDCLCHQWDDEAEEA